MISQPPPASRDSGDFTSGAIAKVALVGDIDEELELALRVNGLDPVRLPGEIRKIPSEARAVFAPGAEPSTVETLCANGTPVVTDAPTSDVKRLAEMLRAGAAEVVVRPSQPDEVARKIWRAIRKAGEKY